MSTRAILFIGALALIALGIGAYCDRPRTRDYSPVIRGTSGSSDPSFGHGRNYYGSYACHGSPGCLCKEFVPDTYDSSKCANPNCQHAERYHTH